ncbi:hypothetical protein NQ315_005202 [Exocentrus adspersus]|uniref:DUF4770 domain-containing protein n=1 Tax=Exocentrus adspersus TaxID=1586481 RepID=A0AAV8VV37_9CUCU|nr:hypothetical protein NQ315_005202 [Exocentrus adspersus]
MSGRKNRGTKRPQRPSETGILDRFSPTKFGKILPTNTKTKQDAFKCFRPGKGECLEYEISQTELKMDAGDTKINIKDTQATYIPAPPAPPRKKKKSEGLCPPMKFINEIWLEKQDALQEKYRMELKKYIKYQKLHKGLKHAKLHTFLLSMAGPEWFQELSPIQLRTVDQLQCCILLDIRDNTISNVQENIGNLGLVRRPRQRHLSKALKLCCKDAVEFLLILYQLINPKRNEYSVNDRLLLSAVVHLTMMDTLRELHVRIPSPPARKTKKENEVATRPAKKYSSPYLEPYSYTPMVPKHTGVYTNPRIQHPDSSYFDYIFSLIRRCLFPIFNRVPKIDWTKINQ